MRYQQHYGFTYFVSAFFRHTNRRIIKIGVTRKNIGDRLVVIRNEMTSLEDFRCEGVIEKNIEKQLHQKFSHLRLGRPDLGNEWFHFDFGGEIETFLLTEIEEGRCSTTFVYHPPESIHNINHKLRSY